MTKKGNNLHSQSLTNKIIIKIYFLALLPMIIVMMFKLDVGPSIMDRRTFLHKNLHFIVSARIYSKQSAFSQNASLKDVTEFPECHAARKSHNNNNFVLRANRGRVFPFIIFAFNLYLVFHHHPTPVSPLLLLPVKN